MYHSRVDFVLLSECPESITHANSVIPTGAERSERSGEPALSETECKPGGVERGPAFPAEVSESAARHGSILAGWRGWEA